MISTLELTKAGSQKEGSHYGATKGSEVARAWCGAHCGCCGGDDADAAEKEPLVAAADRDDAEG